jgi:signal transduction histidine kinase
MLRNQEIRWLVLTSCVISIVSVIAAYFLTPHAVILIVLTSALLIGCNLLFTHLRYREIEKLSSYLRQISNGNYALDVRDNHEGELSILKTDIYKVTLMLSEHSTLLLQDKIRLTDAISDISHQLKTPLTSMMVMSDLLSDPQLPDYRRVEFTRNIRVQLERIEWLIASLLKISRIDAGTVAFKKDKVMAKKLIHQALEPVLIPMDIKEQTVLVQGEDTVSFVGDLNWTAEALINILKNAVEHTPTGGRITISFSENVLYTEIIIEDNGEGIVKEDLRYIFKRFYKGKNASEGSIGIGLAMAYSIITSQNGDITVKSVQGEGTQFHIKFYKQII